MEKLERKRVFIFIGIVFGLDLVLSLMYAQNRNANVLGILMLTPAIAVILTMLITKESFINLPLKKAKGKLKGSVCAYFLPPLLALVGTIMYFMLFSQDFNPLGSSYAIKLQALSLDQYASILIPSYLLGILINPVGGLIQCFGEELGWRGYLYPKLSKMLSNKKATLMTGVVWGLWHAPVVAMGFNYGKDYPWIAVVAMVLFCSVINIILCSFKNWMGSVWSCVLFHAALNGLDNLKPSSLLMSKVPNLFIGPNLVGLIGGIGFVFFAIICILNKKCYGVNQNEVIS